jgi:transposase
MSVQRRYPPELRERAVRLVRETREEDGGSVRAVTEAVGRRLGIKPETLRGWVQHSDAPVGRGTGPERVKALEKQVRELEQANEILLAASTFFARELDPRQLW